MSGLDRAGAQAHEDALLAEATARVRDVPGVRIVGRDGAQVGVLSFMLDGVHPHDIGTILDPEGVAVRTGQHCAQPVMDRYGVPATVARVVRPLQHARRDRRSSPSGLHKVREVFG